MLCAFIVLLIKLTAILLFSYTYGQPLKLAATATIIDGPVVSGKKASESVQVKLWDKSARIVLGCTADDFEALVSKSDGSIEKLFGALDINRRFKLRIIGKDEEGTYTATVKYLTVE